MKASDLFVKSLENEGVDRIFAGGGVSRRGRATGDRARRLRGKQPGVLVDELRNRVPEAAQ